MASTGEAATTIAQPDNETPQRLSPWLLAWLAFLPLTLIRAGTLAESDTFWAIRTGLVTLDRGAIPRVDPFSWTAGGDHWTLNSWAFNVALALAYKVAGLSGVALLGAVICAGIGALVILLARRVGATPAAAGLAAVLGSVPLVMFYSARPQIIDYAAVLGLLWLLLNIVEQRRPGVAVGAIAVLSIAWVNLHAAAPLGIAIAGVTVAFVAATPELRDRVGWCAAAVGATVVGSMVNPYGLGVFTQGARVASASNSVVLEWQPLNPFDPAQLLMFALGLVAVAVAAQRRSVVFMAALAVGAGASVLAFRFLAVLVLVALPMLASAGAPALVRRYAASRRVFLRRGAFAGIAALGVVAATSLTHLGRPEPNLYPQWTHEAIPGDCRLFNEYVLGGWLILQRPGLRVSLDSRNDLYGERRVARAFRVLDGEAPLPESVDCVFVYPSTGLAAELAESPEWETVASEPAGVLFVRR